MNKNLKKILDGLTRDQLVSLLEGAFSSNAEARLALEKAIAVYDPKELYKLTNKSITAVKSSKRFIRYRETGAFFDKLCAINDGIEKLITQDANSAVKLCKRLIDIDHLICERVDDSDGFLLDSYTRTYRLLDRAFVEADIGSKEVGTYLYTTFKEDDYGLREYILANSRQSIKAGAAEVIEGLLKTEPLDEDYAVLTARLAIADALDDVDQYISLIENDSTAKNRPIDERSILDIAARLNKAFRGGEAITWLEKVQDGGIWFGQKTDLLVEACKLEGRDDSASAVMWRRFERTLWSDDYFKCLKTAGEEEGLTLRSKAIVLARSHRSLSSKLQFFWDLGEWELIAEIITNHARDDSLDGSDYSLFRKLSTALAKNDNPLPAVLLRRALVAKVLSGGKSRYYSYALSDLKKAFDFSQQVSEWHNMDDHATYLATLKDQHLRKYSFWEALVPGVHF